MIDGRRMAASTDSGPAASTGAALGRVVLAPGERLIAALSNPARRNAAMAVIAVVYALVWTLYAVIAKSSQDLNADMAETVMLMREWALGYPKHPPLLTWLVALWFTIFPVAEWSYHLLAGVSIGLALHFSFMLAGEWLEGDKRALAPVLLSVVPFYNFLAVKYDHNAATVPLWAFTTWAFMRSLGASPVSGRGLGQTCWGMLAGLGAGAAILTKYWSLFLVLALILAALLRNDRARYFRSGAPWAAALVGALICAPHLLWLVHENFPFISYVAGARTAQSMLDWLRSIAEYSLGTAGYAAVAMVLAAAATRPSRRAICDNAWPSDPHRRTAVILFWTPLLLPVLVAVVTGARLLSLWNMPALGLLPVVMLMSPLIDLPRRAAVAAATLAIAVSATALLASPLIAWWRLYGVENSANYTRLLAPEVAAEWKRTTSQPLKLVGGPFGLAASLSFYLPGRPLTYYMVEIRYPYEHYIRDMAPWADRATILRDGIAIACPSEHEYCLRATRNLMSLAPHAPPKEIVLRRRWLGLEGPPARFTITVVPPSGEP
jgi:4-amino-4-deoxy-L-arabinose transferase-like glycosyltransferase